MMPTLWSFCWGSPGQFTHLRKTPCTRAWGCRRHVCGMCPRSFTFMRFDRCRPSMLVNASWMLLLPRMPTGHRPDRPDGLSRAARPSLAFLMVAGVPSTPVSLTLRNGARAVRSFSFFLSFCSHCGPSVGGLRDNLHTCARPHAHALGGAKGTCAGCVQAASSPCLSIAVVYLRL